MLVNTTWLKEEEKPATRQERNVSRELSVIEAGTSGPAKGFLGFVRSRIKATYAKSRSDRDSTGGEGWKRRNGDERND